MNIDGITTKQSSTLAKSSNLHKKQISKPKPKSSSSSTSSLSLLAMEIPSFMLWVKEEPFLFSILSPTPSTRLSFHMLRKVAEYCRIRRREGYFPHLSYEGWGHISKYKLQLPLELSWALLRAFHVLANKWKFGGGGEAGKKFSELDTKFEEIRTQDDDPDGDICLNTLQFLLFLYIQSYFRLQKGYSRAKNPSFDEHWPGVENGSGGNMNLSKQPRKSSTVPEHGHSDFVETNLEEILAYLDLVIRKPADNSQSQEEDVSRIPIQVVEALSLILGAASLNGNPKDTEFTTLDTAIIAIPEIRKAVDFQLEGGGTVDKNRFLLWVKSNIKLNPWGPTSTAVNQHGVEFSAGIWQKTNTAQNGVYWNTQLYPKGWYLISSVNNQVLYLDSVKAFSSIKIYRCSSSYIYIHGAFSSILVEKCDNCTLFLGPAGKFVKFLDCSNLRVSGAGRFFIFQDVNKSQFNILTPSHPLICGNKGMKRVVLGPYNTFYPQLERDMELVGLGAKLQKWNRPLELDDRGLPVNLSVASTSASGERKTMTPHSNLPAYATLRSDAFTKTVFPFAMSGKTVKNPVMLPRNYARNLKASDGIVMSFKNEVKKANLSEEKTVQLNAIIQARFHTWLKREGHLDQVRGLRSMQKTLASGASNPILETRKSIREEKRRLITSSSSRRNSEGGSSKFVSGNDVEFYDAGKNINIISGGLGLNSSIYFLDGSDTEEVVQDEGNQEKSNKSSLPSMELDDGLLWTPIF